MKKRIIAIIAACAMMITAFAGIAAAGEAEGTFTVGYNYFGAGSYALLSLANNSDYAIAQMGDTPMGTNDNFQIEQIIADIENMCNAGCNGIIVWLPVEDLYTTVGDICAKYEVPFILNDKIPQNPDVLAALQENPFYIGAVAPANAIYGEAIADYAIEQGYTSCLIATATIGDPSDTPRLEAFKAKFEAAGGEILDILYCENVDDATSKLENSLIVNEPAFIYGTGSDYGIAAVNALTNADMPEVSVITSGLDKQALEYEQQGKIEMINGDFWVCGYFSAIIMEAYLHGNQMLDADGNPPYIDDVPPFEVPAEQYELYEEVFLNNTPYSAEETAALVNGTYDDVLAAIHSYSIEERAKAHVAAGTLDAAVAEAAGITLD